MHHKGGGGMSATRTSAARFNDLATRSPGKSSKYGGGGTRKTAQQDKQSNTGKKVMLDQSLNSLNSGGKAGAGNNNLSF